MPFIAVRLSLVPGDRLDSKARRARLHRRARCVARLVRARANAVRPGLYRLRSALGRRRTKGSLARCVRDVGAALLVHGGVRAYWAAGRIATVQRGRPEFVGERKHEVRSQAPYRLPLDLVRAPRTRCKIDTYQANYFVIDSFAQLFEPTAPDFTPLCAALMARSDIDAGVLPAKSNIGPDSRTF
jgi:hypothetical protein